MKSLKIPRPTWYDVKAKLANFDRAGLFGLLQDLYAASKDNQAFLHARFSLSDDVLALQILHRPLPVAGCVQESVHVGRQSQEGDLGL